MFTDYDPEFDLWNVYNNQGQVVASFASFEEAFRYTHEQ